MLENDQMPLDFLVGESASLYNSNSPQYIEVLADTPGGIDNLLTYKIPPDLIVKPGDILTLPFGAQQIGGIAVRFLEKIPANLQPEKIKEVIDVLTAGFFPPHYWELLEQISQYYYTPLKQVIKSALPPGVLGKSQKRVRLIKDKITQEKWQNDPYFGVNDPAAQIVQLLQQQAQNDYSWRHIKNKVKFADRGLRELKRRGWVETYLEQPKNQRPKLQKAVIFINDDIDDNLTEKQQEVLNILQRRGGDLWLNDLLDICQVSDSVVIQLQKKGCVIIENREILRVPTWSEELLNQDQAKILNTAQNHALENINNVTGFSEILLHGVTGSGKTEVYLQAIAPILQQEKSVLVLVPEIGLTPQLTDRFRARFGNKVCVYHSALSDGERYDTWRQMLTGESQVVIGTRSAIFAPLPDLGLIILDEEHDESFKQEQPIPTYHARTVAKWRAKLVNCPLILGSATPSLETWLTIKENDQNQHYLSLPERIESRPLPPVEIIDMRTELKQGNKMMFSRKLQAALTQMKAEKKQGILFIHRRGHSTFVSCRSCGYIIECPNCDVSLSYHNIGENAPELLKCHYCNYGRSHPQNCPECSSPYLKFFGGGTQKVEQELKKYFPELKLIRFDSDTTKNKGSHRRLLSQFAKGEADLLVGTQMLTKGLDLPQVTLVGIVAADGLLYLPDYRSGERAFQTLVQVAGRSGRGDDPGKVIVQTYTPDHPVITAVKYHDYKNFTTRELEQRASLNYPPYGRLILLKFSSMDAKKVEYTANKIADKLAEEADNKDYEILGPAPAGILRVANKYRWQILLKFPGNQLPKIPDWEIVRSLCDSDVSLTIDVDPLNMW